MVCCWVGPKGAIAGAIAGAALAGTVSMGIQTAAARGLRAPSLPISSECAANATYIELDSLVSTYEFKILDFFKKGRAQK